MAEKQKAYLRGMEIVNEVTDIDDQLSKLDLLWLDEQRRTIAALGDEIIALNKEKEEKGIQIGQYKERIRQLDYEVLPDHYQQLTYMEDRLQDEFPVEYQESIGLPRYQQELARLKRADIVHKNFSSRLEQSVKEQDTARKSFSLHVGSIRTGLSHVPSVWKPWIMMSLNRSGGSWRKVSCPNTGKRSTLPERVRWNSSRMIFWPN